MASCELTFSGAQLRELRLGRALSQRELAREAGVSQTTVHRAETGERVPHRRTIGALAEALGAEPGALFADAKEQPMEDLPE